MSREIELDTKQHSTEQHCQHELSKTGEEQWRALLERWKTKLFVQLWLQERSVYFYDWCNNVFAYSIILISSASSATLFSSTTYYVQYIVGAMSIVT
jgi:hypothetical protein